jgi:hypothetical protein
LALTPTVDDRIGIADDGGDVPPDLPVMRGGLPHVAATLMTGPSLAIKAVGPSIGTRI